MTAQYKIRFDMSRTSEIDKLFSYLSSKCPQYMYCYEGGEDNPHMHFYIETDEKEPTLRSNFRKMGFKGNGGYSMKSIEYRPLEYLSYMMKERNWKNVNLPPELIASAQAHSIKVKNEIAEKKKAKIPVWKQIFAIVKEKYYDEKHPKYYQPTLIMKEIVNYYIDNGLLIRRFMLQSIYDTIVMNINPDKYELIFRIEQ